MGHTARPSISIVIPAHNEQENVRSVVRLSLEELRKLADDYEVVVVDDASSDSTLELLQEMAREHPEHVRVISSAAKLGCHRAVLLGLRNTHGDLLFAIPADLQINPDQLKRCLAAAQYADYVCTDRRPRADPIHRRLMSRGYNLAVRAAFGICVHDVDSSILIRRAVIEAVGDELEGDSDFIPVEMLARAVGRGFRMTEVQIEHHPRVAGKPTALTPREAARTLVKLALSVARMRELRRVTRVVSRELG